MACSSESENVVVSWQKMRGYWIYSAFQISNAAGNNVKTYLNTFVKNNPGYSFTITQLYDELFDVCITTSQCSQIKRNIERKFKIELPEARTQELFPDGAIAKKSMTDALEFRQLNQERIPELNKSIIRRKHKEARDHFSNVREAFNRREQQDFLAFDIEAYEHNQSKILEIGYVVVRFTPPRSRAEGNLPKAEVISRVHLIIEENLHFKNKDRVPDNRYGFRFGLSETLKLEDAIERFREDVIESDYILGHSAKHDDDYLRKIGVDLKVHGKEILDTQIVQTYKESLKESNAYFMRGLSYLLKEYQVNYEESDLHNAGCDAFYTMMVFLRQMGYSAQNVNAIIAS